ncbi:cytochrome P450 [Flagelloscypha sp. PMI_526]|nr:cytochrome P450 [Flagelloscypha sp. PMI_526]
MVLTGTISLSRIASTTATVLFCGFLAKLIRHRTAWRAKNYPGPPHHWFWGHLLTLRDTFQLFPPDAHPDYTAFKLVKDTEGLCFLDTWPFTTPMCIIADGTVGDRVVRGDNLPKCEASMVSDRPVLGHESIVLATGEPASQAHWKMLRKALTPGFARGHLERSWTSDIIEEVNNMVKKLNERAQDRQPFGMSLYLADTTCDIILKIVMGKSNPVLRANILEVLNAQLDHATTVNHIMPFLDTINPVRRFGEWKRTRAMDALITPVINEHISAKREGTTNPARIDVIDYAILDSDLTVTDMSAQVKTFVFAGHDTTAVTLAWTYYEFTRNPKILSKIREEHDRVFGKLGTEAAQIVANPSILNELKYTNAAIKETLRLYPPASSVRQSSNYSVRESKTGKTYPVDGLMLWVNHYALHRHKSNWDDPGAFKLERWFDEKGEQLQTTPIAWQPFSKGAKNCMGLELALLEQRIILALTVRKFEFEYSDKEQPYNTFRVTVWLFIKLTLALNHIFLNLDPPP